MFGLLVAVFTRMTIRNYLKKIQGETMGRKKGDTSLVSKSRRLKALTLFNEGMSVSDICIKLNFFDYTHAYKSIKQAINECKGEQVDLYRDRQQEHIDRDLALIEKYLHPQSAPMDNNETETITLGGQVIEGAPKITFDDVPLLDVDGIAKFMTLKYDKIFGREAKLQGTDKDKNAAGLSGDLVVHVVQDEKEIKEQTASEIVDGA